MIKAMMKEQKMQNYTYHGTIPQWIPGIGVVVPGQTFASRYPCIGNPLITPSEEEATPVGEVTEEDKVCTKCVKTKSSKEKKKA